MGEIRRGIESINRRDQVRALALNRWFHALVTEYEARILLVDQKSEGYSSDQLPRGDGSKFL